MKHILILFLFILANLDVNAQIAENFFDDLVTNDVSRPVGMTFDYADRLYIWEKHGYVKQIDTTAGSSPKVIFDIHERIGHWGDHGLLGFALDPNFAQNKHIYMAYVLDRHYLFNYGTDNYDADSTIKKQATIARVSRFTINETFDFIDPATEKIILGETIEDAVPIIADFHGIGSLFFGTDGSLLFSTGDGGNDDVLDSESNNFHSGQALEDGIIQEKELIGPFRSQLIDNLNGKLLRINPETGAGYPSNPFYDDNNPYSDASKVFMLGFRNPFRVFLQEGTGSHNVEDGNPGRMIGGDVGASSWEELNILTEKRQNFGWPDYEGFHTQYPIHYDTFYENLDAPNPIGSDCDKAYFVFQDLILNENSSGEYFFKNPCDENVAIPDHIETFVHRPPAIVWNNAMWNPPARTMVKDYNPESGNLGSQSAVDLGLVEEGFHGHSSIPGFYYESGILPDSLNNSIFVSDNLGWIRAFTLDDNDEVISVTDIHQDVKGIVHMIFHPEDQSIYYANFEQGEIRKIQFGGNAKPQAIISSDKIYGSSPLNVSFTGDASFDPQGEDLIYAWDFGNGEISDEINPTIEFVSENNESKAYDVVLVVTDSIGQTSTAEMTISINNTPPEVSIAGAKDGDLYPVSSLTILPLSSEVFDNEEEKDALNYSWELFLHHNLHYHPEEPKIASNFSALIDPIGCNGENYWYRIRLTVSDNYGLSGTDEIQIYPNCDDPFGGVKWNPAVVNPADIDLSWEKEGEKVESLQLERFDAFGQFSIISLQNYIDAFATYKGKDTNPVTGENVYRVKSIKEDGSYDYSTFYSVRYPFNPIISIYPNPVVNSLSLEIETNLWEDVEVKVFDAAGSMVKKSVHAPVDFDHQIIVPVEGMAAGVYWMTLRINGSLYVEMFVVGR